MRTLVLRRAAPRSGYTTSTTPWLALGLIFLTYAVLVAALVQRVVLPYLFPAFHAGHGLLVGGDWIEFHRLAVERAEAIRAHGWEAWSLRPEGQAPAGIAAAIYAITVPEPWTVIPVNAALHAGAALVLLRIVSRFVPDWRLAVAGVLPFFLYPSAMAWYTQNHKDAYFIAGLYLLLNAWVVLACCDTWQGGRRRLAEVGLCTVGGAALVWLVRPYGVQMFQGLAGVATVGLTALYGARAIRGSWHWRQAATATAVTWGLVVGLTPFTAGGVAEGRAPTRPGAPSVLEVDPRPPAVADTLATLATVWGEQRPLGAGWPLVASPERVLPAALRSTPVAGAAPAGAPGPRYRLDQPMAGWVLLGYDVDLDRLLTDEPTDLMLYWQLPADSQGIAGEDFAPDGTGRWVQVLRGVRNGVRDGGFERDRLLTQFPDDIYEADPGVRVLAASVAGHGTAAGLRNGTAVPRSSLVSRPVPAAGGRLYLQAAWVRTDGGRAWVGRQWLPSAEYSYVVGDVDAPSWTHFAQVVLAPEGTEAARIWLLNTQRAGTALFDDVLFVDLGTLDPAACQPDDDTSRRACTAPIIPPAHLPPVAGLPPLADELAVRSRWQPSGWLPAPLEARLFTLASIRRGFLAYYPHAASNIDADVAFWSVGDFVAYLPRALQIGLLAPFPSHWIGQGHLEATTFQRRVTGVEMVGVYLALACLPCAVGRWRRRPELWLLLGLCLGMILIYALVTPNVGSLHRARYGPLMVLVALGVAGGLVTARAWCVRVRSPAPGGWA